MSATEIRVMLPQIANTDEYEHRVARYDDGKFTAAVIGYFATKDPQPDFIAKAKEDLSAISRATEDALIDAAILAASEAGAPEIIIIPDEEDFVAFCRAMEKKSKDVPR